MNSRFSLAAATLAGLAVAASTGLAAETHLAVATELEPAPLAAAPLPGCGTVLTPEQAQAVLAEIEQGISGPSSVAAAPPYYVPIAPHIVRQSDGTGGLSEARYNQANADANLHYQSAQMIFYTKGAIDYIDDDEYYFNINTLAEIDSLRETNRVAGAINIYFTEILDYESGALCGISAFTFSSIQSIAMRNACTAVDTGLGNHSTYSHEIGHYFDLFHTHEPAFGTEYVDGSNCTVAGDLLCDTPADPRLSSSTVNSTTCQYTGGATDPNSDPYVPDTSQLMSYSLKHCRDNFSVQSLAKAQTTLINDRPGLITNPVDAPAFVDLQRGAGLALSAPRPNPAAQMSEMSLTLPAPTTVTVTVYDVRGAHVRTIAYGPFAAGTHVVGWDGLDSVGALAAPGIYFARAAAGSETVTRKIQRFR